MWVKELTVLGDGVNRIHLSGKNLSKKKSNFCVNQTIRLSSYSILRNEFKNKDSGVCLNGERKWEKTGIREDWVINSDFSPISERSKRIHETPEFVSSLGLEKFTRLIGRDFSPNVSSTLQSALVAGKYVSSVYVVVGWKVKDLHLRGVTSEGVPSASGCRWNKVRIHSSPWVGDEKVEKQVQRVSEGAPFIPTQECYLDVLDSTGRF